MSRIIICFVVLVIFAYSHVVLSNSETGTEVIGSPQVQLIESESVTVENIAPTAEEPQPENQTKLKPETLESAPATEPPTVIEPVQPEQTTPSIKNADIKVDDSSQPPPPLTAEEKELEKDFENDSTTFSDNKDIQSLYEQLQTLKAEIKLSKIKSHKPEPLHGDPSLGRPARRVYRSRNEFNLGLTADISFYRKEDRVPVSPGSSINIFTGFRPHERVLFNGAFGAQNGGAENHAGGSTQVGSNRILFSYIDLLLSKEINVRVGHVPVPFGSINDRLSPNSYLSTAKPAIETEIIPGYWNEYGIIVWGQSDSLTYHAGLINSFNATNFKYDSWITSANTNAQNAEFRDFTGVFRLTHRSDYLHSGISYSYGDHSQQTTGLVRSTIHLWDVFVQMGQRPFYFKLQASGGQSEEAEAITTIINPANNRAFPKAVSGYLAEFAFDLLSPHDLALPLFVRYENFDLNQTVPSGFHKDKTLLKEYVTLGLNFIPTADIRVKLDYQFRKNKSEEERDVFGLSASVEY